MPRLSLSPLRLLRAPLVVLLAFIIGVAGILTSTPRVAEAAPPTAITYAGSAANTGLANTPTTWTVGFTSSATGALAAGGTITVQFHAAFTIPATLPVGLSPTFANCSATGTAVGSVITVTLANSGGVCALPLSTPATMTLGSIVNPSAGLYLAGAAANFRVQTSSDNTFANHATNITINATAVTGVTFTGTPLTPGATANYTAAFTVSAGGSLAAGNTITTTFSPAFALPGAPTITLGGTFQNCSATAVGVANVATITLADSGGTCALPASSPASVVVQGVTNPGAGVYPAASFSVATSKDVTAASPAAAGTVTIAATTVTAVTFAGTPQTPGSSASWTVGFTPTAVGALTTGNTITATFDSAFTVPAGAVAVTLSAAFNNCTATGNGVGTVVTITLAGVGCALNSLTPATVTLAGITNPAAGVYAAAGFGVSTTRDIGVGLPANVTIATTAVTAVTFAGTPQTPGTVAPWVVGFTPSATGALAGADTITIVFNPSFTVPAGPTAVTLSAAFSGCTGSFTGAGTTATVTLAGGGCTLNGLTAATITIPGLTNPAVVGTYAAAGFSVRTSKDGSNVAPAAAVTIATTTVTAVTFAGTPQTPGTTASWVVGFTPSATGGLTNGNTITIVFDAAFTVPAGPTAVTLSAAFSGCTGSFTGAGTTATVTLAGGGCTLNGSTAATITIPGLTNPAIVGTYAAAGFSVRTTRDGTNAAPAAAVTIATTAVTGVTFVGTPQTPGATASWTVGFTPTITGGLVAGNTITVTFDPAFVIPATPTITLGVAILACSATGATVGTTVTITLANSGGICDVSNLTPATLTIAGITNPTAGVYPAAGFGVRTTRDGTTVLPANVTIATTAVTGVTFVGTPQTPGATAAWTVGFTPTATGSLTAGHTITVTFDPTFVIPATPTITLGAAILACSATGATVGSTVTITLANSGGTCDVSSLTPVTLSIAGITNPTAGVYPAAGFGLRTTRDGTTVQPANVTIATTSVTAVTFVGTPQTPGATAAWTVGFTPTATGGLTTGNTITIVFNASFAVPAGPTAVTLSAAFSSCTGSATGAGTTLTVTLAGAGCTLNGSTAATVTIPGLTNPAVIGTYAAAGFTVRTTRDATNVVSGATVVIATTAVTAVTFAGTPQTPGSTAVWTVGFTPTAAGNLVAGNTITVTFDPAFTIPGVPAITLPTGFASCTATGATVANVVTVTLAGGGCTLNGLTPATLTIAGITNPAAAVYAAAGFGLRTSANATTVAPAANVTIAAPAATAVTGVSFAGAPTAPNAVAAWTVGFTTSTSGQLAVGSTITVTFNGSFSIVANPAIALSPAFSGCTATATQALAVVTITLAGAPCSLAASTPATVTISSVTNPTAGSYPAAGFRVQTSADVTQVSPAGAGAVVVIAAASVSGVTLTAAPTSAASASVWSAGFTTSASGALAAADTISITFHPSFVLAGVPTISLGAAFTGCSATAASAANVITVTLANSGGVCAVGASSPVTFTISGVTNPSAGTYAAATFSIATSKDVTAVVAPAAVTITATPSSVTFVGATQTAGSVTTWTVGFRSSVAGALAAGDTITLTFNPAFVIPATPVATVTTGFALCSATAAAAANVVTLTLANNGGVCAMPASTNASLTLAGLTNPLAGSYAAGGFTVATNRDNTAAAAASAVTITSGVGAVTFTAAPLTASSASTWTVGFTAGPSGALAAANTISLTFHPSFTVPATPTVTLGAGFSSCSATASGAGAVVTVTLASSGGVCALLANAAASLTVGGITNAATAATYPGSAFTVATSVESSASGAGTDVVITAAAGGGGGGGGGAPAPVVTGGGGGGGGSAVPAPVGSPNAEPGLGPIGTSGATVATIAATSTSTVTVNTEEAHLTITAPAGALPGGGQLFAGMVSDLSTVTRNATLPSTASLIAGFVVQATTRNGVPVTKDFGQLVELEITLQASSVPRTATNESLVLAYWEGTVWLEIPASVTVRLDGSALIRATVDHFTLFGVIVRSVPLGSAPASTPGASAPPSTSAGVGAGTFASTPTFSATNQAISVFNGGSVDQLEAAARGAGASGVWAQDALGVFHLLIPGGPAFLRDAFAARFPRGFVGLTAMTLVRSDGTVSASPAAPVTPTVATAPAAPSASGATTYVVSSTDTLSEIGSRFDIPWLRIAEANGIAGPNYLVRPGQVLTIPASGGAPSAAAPTPVAAVISIPTPMSTAPASAPGTYVVSATDTLSDIAVRFGVPWQRIAAANAIAGPSYFVRSGQTLTIPSPSGALSYLVTATDTLSSIGAQFNIDWLRLAEVNGIEGPSYFVRPGQTLTIPAS